MKNIIKYIVSLFILLTICYVIPVLTTGCDDKWDKTEKLKKQGVTWNIWGYVITTDRTNKYQCVTYQIVSDFGNAHGGNGNLGVGGSAVVVNSIENHVYRILMYDSQDYPLDGYGKRLIREILCSTYETTRCGIVSKDPYRLE